jgi:uncharacterized protein HemY
MRAALWILALFGVAVAVALFAGNNHAVVTLFWPPHRVDISLNLMVLVLIGVFVLLHFALKALSALASLPVQARRWRAQQKERAMYAALMDALAHLLAGRFIRAARVVARKKPGSPDRRCRHGFRASRRPLYATALAGPFAGRRERAVFAKPAGA